MTTAITSASPGSSYVEDCKCRSVLVDHVRRRVSHPYFICPYFGMSTDLDRPPVPPAQP